MCWGGLAIIDITFLALAPKFLGVGRPVPRGTLSGLCGTRNVFFGRPSVSLMNSYVHVVRVVGFWYDPTYMHLLP